MKIKLKINLKIKKSVGVCQLLVAIKRQDGSRISRG